MTIEQIKEKILTDDSFVLEEIIRLQYLFSLHGVIRSNLTRQEPIATLSVAEHIFHLTVLAPYFLLSKIRNTLLILHRLIDS